MPFCVTALIYKIFFVAYMSCSRVAATYLAEGRGRREAQMFNLLETLQKQLKLVAASNWEW